jgi:hypothetical protein
MSGCPRPKDHHGGVAPYALDAADAERMWEESLRLLPDLPLTHPL